MSSENLVELASDFEVRKAARKYLGVKRERLFSSFRELLVGQERVGARKEGFIVWRKHFFILLRSIFLILRGGAATSQLFLTSLLSQLEEEELDFIEYDEPRSGGWIERAWSGIKNVSKRVLGMQVDPEGYAENRKREEQLADDLADFPSAENDASIVSRVCFSWVGGLVRLGGSRPLYMRDLGELRKTHQPAECAKSLQRAWDDETKDQADHVPSLANALWKTLRYRIMTSGLARVWRLNSGFLEPWLIKKLLVVVENPARPGAVWFGLMWSMIILIASALSTILFNIYCQEVIKGEVLVKNSVTSLLYRKLLRLSASSKQSNIHGKLMNLIGSDTTRIQDMMWYLQFFWLSPGLAIVCIISVTFLTSFYAALAGCAVLAVLAPIGAFVAKKMEKLREAQTAITDARVHATNEIFHTMKTVKLYALEEHFAKGADEARQRELKTLLKLQLVRAVSESINDAMIPIMSLATLATFVLRGGVLTPSIAFAVLSTFGALHWPFIMITSSISATVECFVSIRRMEEFLSLPEVPGLQQSEEVESGEISIKDASFAWEFEESLKNINFNAKKGTLTCIVGPIGSGKSSLLNTMLGEMRKISGHVHVRGKISYAPQTPFLLHTTVRENITFGQEFDEERYAKTIEACALQADLDVLLAGDQTVIGERGINLSGGQKARIAMARAVYSDTEIVLLDDPLSAVDAHVGHKLFNECIKELLKEKTVLLVTHQLQYVTHGDFLVVMANGQIEHSGTPSQLREAGVDLAALIDQFNEELNKFHADHDATDAKKSDDNEELDLDGSFGSVHLTHSAGSSNGSLNKSRRLHTSNGIDPHAHTNGATDPSQISILNDVHYHSDLSEDQQKAVKSSVNVTSKEERGTGSIGAAVYRFYFGVKWKWWALALLLVILHQVLTFGLQIYVGRWSAKNTPAGNKTNIALPSSSHSSSYVLFDHITFTPSDLPTTNGVNSVYISSAHHLLDYVYEAGSEFASKLGSTGAFFGDIASKFSASAAKNKVPSSTKTFLAIYTAGSLLIVFLQMLRISIILVVSTWTGKAVYLKMFDRLIHAPMSFFDTTPKGRIASRCASDTDSMDSKLGEPLYSGVVGLSALISTLTVTFISVGWWALAFVPVMIINISIFNRVIGPFRDATRLDGNAKAPLNTLFSESLNGLYTLRAFKREPEFATEMLHKVDGASRTYYYRQALERWLNIRVGILGAVTSAVLGSVAVFSTRSIDPGLVAVALVGLLENSHAVGYLIHDYAHVETYMNSVERIKQYTEIQVERPQIIDHCRPPKDWPQYGCIKFENVSFRYRPGLPLVLNEISLLIKPGEKIGVVGRTGAGKSSLLSALLSLSPISTGRIMIDDEDISKMGVGDLRSRLSIIPQDPVIFDGTIRHNLDPFGHYEDKDIWETIRRVHLLDVIDALPSKLDEKMAEDGANLSLGQRQLICVGRALLKHSKILLLDEASSSIDLETDYLLQKTLRTEFSHCTTITIAHRLATIMDSDRVLVLDAGKVKEFDAPNILLARPDSLFSLLHQQTLHAAALARDENDSAGSVASALMVPDSLI